MAKVKVQFGRFSDYKVPKVGTIVVPIFADGVAVGHLSADRPTINSWVSYYTVFLNIDGGIAQHFKIGSGRVGVPARVENYEFSKPSVALAAAREFARQFLQEFDAEPVRPVEEVDVRERMRAESEGRRRLAMRETSDG